VTDGSGNTSSTQFAYDPSGQLVAEMADSGQWTSYLANPQGTNDFLARVDSNGVTWLLTDHQGSVTAALSADGSQVLAQATYDAFGNATMVSGTAADLGRLGFQGGMTDAATRLVHFGDRDYDPTTGRWRTADPANADINTYRGMGNGPTNFVDPNGDDGQVRGCYGTIPRRVYGCVGGTGVGLGCVGTRGSYGTMGGLRPEQPWETAAREYRYHKYVTDVVAEAGRIVDALSREKDPAVQAILTQHLAYASAKLFLGPTTGYNDWLRYSDWLRAQQAAAAAPPRVVPEVRALTPEMIQAAEAALARARAEAAAHAFHKWFWVDGNWLTFVAMGTATGAYARNTSSAPMIPNEPWRTDARYPTPNQIWKVGGQPNQPQVRYFAPQYPNNYRPPAGQGTSPAPATRSTAPFTMWASADQSKGIHGVLNNRAMIEFVIEAGPQASPRGHVLFKEMVNHFGTNARGVVGSWTYGSNLARFNELTAQGMSPEQAAAATWTGTQAAQNGFRTVTVIDKVGSPGAYTKVLVEFTP
jgi:RHS repeat-associated protein